MSSEGVNGGRISVSEDKLRLLFAEFKLELLKEMSGYALVADVGKWREEMDKRVRMVEDNQISVSAVGRFQRLIVLPIGIAVFTAAVAIIIAVLSGGRGPL